MAEDVDTKGVLLKRKDFLNVDERAGSHPNRTYYFKRVHDLEGVIDTCSKKLQVDLVLLQLCILVINGFALV